MLWPVKLTKKLAVNYRLALDFGKILVHFLRLGMHLSKNQ